MPWIRTLAVIFTLFSTAALAQPVIKDGKEWLQPKDFVNLTWYDVAQVCDPVTGLCDGTLGSTDVTGYTWASVDEVSGLFNAYGVAPPLTGLGEVNHADSSWAPAFLDDFDHTYISSRHEYVWGWARTADTRGASYTPACANWFESTVFDTAITDNSEPNGFEADTLGVFLYTLRPNTSPATVPTFPTYVLIFTVLGLLAIATRGLSRRNAREG